MAYPPLSFLFLCHISVCIIHSDVSRHMRRKVKPLLTVSSAGEEIFNLLFAFWKIHMVTASIPGCKKGYL